MSPRAAATAIRTASRETVPQDPGTGRLRLHRRGPAHTAEAPTRTDGSPETTWAGPGAGGRDLTVVPVAGRRLPLRSGGPGPGSAFVPEYPSAARRTGAIEHMAAHKFDPDRSAAEGTFLETQVITPFIAPPPRNALLKKYDQFEFALRPEPGKIVIPTSAKGSSLGVGGVVPSEVDRRMMWQTWHLAVHEYLHNLAHPAFRKAVAGPVMREGFTEFFTKKLLSRIAPVAHLDKSLVQKVEGGTFLPPTTKEMVGPYETSPSYAANLAHVENVAAKVPGGANAVRSAYFQGHVEMLGIDPVTHGFVTTPPASVDPSLVTAPAGIVTLADLADRSGVSEQSIRTANPGLPAVGLPPQVRLPGLPWEKWNPEQQAEAIEDYNIKLRKSKDGTATLLDLSELSTLLPYMSNVWARRGAPHFETPDLKTAVPL